MPTTNRLHRKSGHRMNGHSRRKAGRPPREVHAARAGREAQGQSRRARCQRSSHSDAGIDDSRRDPLGLIEKSNRGRLEQLLPVRFTRMLESPFAFFRGTAVVQAHDLKNTPAAGIIVQSCGDCHLMNFGAFASPERALIFDINDFDETLPAPFEWDVKRLASSLVLGSRWRKFARGVAREASRAAVRGYREQMARFAGMSVLDVWYARITMDDVMEMFGRDQELRKRVARIIQSARKRTSETVFHKMTRQVNGRVRIADHPPLLYHLNPAKYNSREQLAAFFDAYKKSLPPDRRILLDRYQLVDSAFKVVGVGSVGTLCYVTLWMADADDPLFLQVKQARHSVLEGLTGPSPYEHDGERVVVGQRLMQSASDIFLGWARGLRGNDFYVRQLRDQKASADLATASERILIRYAMLCGKTLARAHSKSGKAAEISGYLGPGRNFDDAVTDYAVSYANQVEKDYDAFRAAVRSGRFRTETSQSELETAVR
jgi:uncharacterized protein (DUF2252 family)